MRNALPILIIPLITSCVAITPTTLKTMSDDKLCELLGPNWISTSNEREKVYTELKKRNVVCSNGNVIQRSNIENTKTYKEESSPKKENTLLPKRKWNGNSLNIALLDLKCENIGENVSTVLSDKLRNELITTQKYIVVERNRMDAILQEQGFQQTGCTNIECAVEIGQLIGIEMVMAGSVGKVSDLYLITLRLIDVKSGKIIKSVEEEIEGELKDVLRIGLPNIAQKISF